MKAFYAIALAALAASAAAVTIREIDLLQGELTHIEWLETNKDAPKDQRLRIMYVLDTEDDAADDVTIELDNVVQYTTADGFVEGAVLTDANAEWNPQADSLPGDIMIATLTFKVPELAMEGPYKVTIEKAAKAGGEARNNLVYDLKAQKSCEEPIEFGEEMNKKCVLEKFAGGCDSEIYPLNKDKSKAGIYSKALDDWVKEFPMVEGKDEDGNDKTVSYFIDVDAEANSYTVGPDTPMDAKFRYALYNGGNIDEYEQDVFHSFPLVGCPDWRDYCEANSEDNLPALAEVPADFANRYLDCNFNFHKDVVLNPVEDQCRGKQFVPDGVVNNKKNVTVEFMCQEGRSLDDGTAEKYMLECKPSADGRTAMWVPVADQEYDKFVRCGASVVSASMGLFVAALVAVKSLF